ncbi:NAD(P)/FAD-dependent oxidoreductase [Candidatus Micrarchaeota archaeon]|nr:NAD(P)/FAD-dependent oxidoreductase [Candidatus Micrarchaeota archaeon]
MKVHIVGAGPSGSVAAISAIRNGYDAVVSEEHIKCGEPENCSGLFSKDGLESLKDFVDYKKHIKNPIYGADIYLGDEKIPVRTREPVAFVSSRCEFDQALAAKAEQEGARFTYGKRVNGEFWSKNIIGADGPTSHVANHFGFPKIEEFVSTMQARVRYKVADPHAVEVYLSNEKFPGFFAWIIPHDEENAEIGVGAKMPNKGADAFAQLLKLKKIEQNQIKTKPSGWVIPVSVRKRTSLNRNNHKVILVGDAAGQVKATTGGGVIFGGNCGILAGKFANSPKRYEIEWRLRYELDLRAHKTVHDYLGTLNLEQMNRLGSNLKKIGLHTYLSEHGHMDRPTRMIKPQFLLHSIRSIVGI